MSNFPGVSMNADDAAVKESRRVLRLVHEHLAQAHLNLGAQQEHSGLVDVIYHPTSRLPYLNYVMPRRNTAWIPGPEVENGLAKLREKARNPRVIYIEGLFLPLFAKTLRELHLQVEQETPIMAFRLTADAHLDSVKPSPTPDGFSVCPVNDQDGLGMWWYVWRNAYYEVLTRGVEPIYIGHDMRAVTLGQQVDLLLYHSGYPVGVTRLTVHGESAHLSALAVMREFREPATYRLLVHGALRAAQERGCRLVFTTGDDDTERKLLREVGFVDFGSILCYAESGETSREDARELAQPVFALY
ncbi:MAG: hypothetical protein SF029_15940 [bacterium]|nr:hypothetical protein [bacterium]